jgi:L-lactate dehydrogenase
MAMDKGHKIGVVGAGQVGATCAYTLLMGGLVSDLVLIDLNAQRVRGEALDLSHGLSLRPPAEVIAGTYADLSGADIVIIAAGVSQKPGESRMDLVRGNAKVFAQIIPEVMRYAPDALLLIITNPVDVLTFAAQRLSGLPEGRVIGSGTVLDTARLRYLISRHTQIDPRNIHAYVLGEHGQSELPAWSAARVAGVELDAYCQLCDRCEGSLLRFAMEAFDAQVRNVADEIIRAKGATYYAVAVAVQRIVEAILRDEQAILTVSTVQKGAYGLHDVALSLPAIVGREGVRQVLAVGLDPAEEAALLQSAEAIRAGIREMG